MKTFIFLSVVVYEMTLACCCRHYSKEDKIQWIPGINEKRATS